MTLTKIENSWSFDRTEQRAKQQPTHRSSTLTWLTGSVILTIAAAIRFFHIGTQPLWVDEGFSWWDAQQTMANMWNLVPQCDPHPPLYFAALKAWTAGFGDSAAAMRALSAVFGIGTIAVVIFAGREIDSRIGWLAGLMFALTPFQVDYSREARPYALLCFGSALIVLSVLRMTRMLREQVRTGNVQAVVPMQLEGSSLSPVRARDGNDSIGAIAKTITWVLLTCAGAILMWTNDTAVFTLVSLGAALITILSIDRNFRSSLKPLLFVAAIIVALWLPYLPKLVEQAHGVIADFWIPPPTGGYVKDTLRALISLSSTNAFWWSVAALAGGLYLLWRRGLWREALILGTLIILPVTLNYAFSVMVRPIFLSRTLIGITPAVVVLMASSALLLQSSFLRHSALAAMISAHIFAMVWWINSGQANEPWDRIAKEIITTGPSIGGHTNALVLLTANQLALPLSHALEDLRVSLPLQGLPTNFPSPGLNARYPSGKCAPSLLGQDLSPLTREVTGYSVVYFITRTNNVYDPGNGVAKFLSKLGFKQSLVETFDPGSLEVHKFVASVTDTLKPLPAIHAAVEHASTAKAKRRAAAKIRV